MNIRLIGSVVKELFYSFDHGDVVGRELIRKRVLQGGFVGNRLTVEVSIFTRALSSDWLPRLSTINLIGCCKC